MKHQQEFWHSMQRKYEENNKTLEKRQLELKLKLEAIDAIMGDGKRAEQERGLALDYTPEQKLPSGSEFKSCSCAEDKGGFFKCVFSLFGSNKSKGPPPASPVPQELPTKEDKQSDKDNVTPTVNVAMRSARITPQGANLKNENCMCNPCEAYEQSLPQKDGDSCSCSICSRESISKVRRDDSICNCSTCSRSTGKKDEPCCCNYGKQIGDLELRRNPENPKTASLNSMDLFYMQNIHDLATQHKKLLKDVTTLETQAKIYDDVLKNYKNVDAAPRGYHLNNTIMPPLPPDSDQKSNAELKLENFLLKNELKEMRLEVRQYIERMEGPMQFKIESERFKCLQLEQKLEEAKKEHLEVQDFLQNEINSLKMQQCNSNKKIYDLTTANEQLKGNLENLKAKCAQLEDDLVRQKISEAETLKRMKAALEDARNNSNNAVKDECSLHHIARELSKILAECEPCEQCISLPEDLTEAAKLLKSLTDMVDRKLPQTESERKTDAVPASVKKLIADIDETPTGPRSAEIGSPKTSKGSKVSETAPPPATRESRFKPREVKISGAEEEQSPDAVEQVPESEADPKESTPRSPEIPMKTTDGAVTIPEFYIVPESEDPKESTPRSPEIPMETTDGAVTIPESYTVPEYEADPKESTPRSTEIPMETTDGAVTIPESYTVEGFGESVKIQEPDLSSGQPRSAPIAAPFDIPSTKSSCKCVKPRAAALEQKPSVPADETKKKKSCKCSRKGKGVTEKPSEPVEARSSTFKGGKSCKCNKKSADFTKPVEQAQTAPVTDLVPVSRKGDGVDQIWPKGSERFKLSHQVTASRSQEMLKSETSVKCLKVKENFPFEVDTQVDVLNRPPDGVHVTTTITNSGTLEVITEGPEGVIETTLIYTNSGNVEVVTEIQEHHGRKGLCNRGKIKATSAPKAIEAPKALEAPAVKGTASEPGKTSGAPSGVDVTARSSEPINPNCKCIECPGLGPKGADTSGKEKVPEPVQEKAGEIVQPDDGKRPAEEIVVEQHITENQLALNIQADSPGLPASDAQDVPASDAPAVPASDAQEVPASDASAVPASDTPAVPASDTPEVPKADTPDSA